MRSPRSPPPLAAPPPPVTPPPCQESPKFYSLECRQACVPADQRDPCLHPSVAPRRLAARPCLNLWELNRPLRMVSPRVPRVTLLRISKARASPSLSDLPASSVCPPLDHGQTAKEQQLLEERQRLKQIEQSH